MVCAAMPRIDVDDLADPRIAEYRNVTDPARLREHGLFVAEGRLVVRTLLAESPLRTRSVLVTRNALESLEDVLASRDDLPVLVVPQALMNGIVGFNIHRGCLALGERPAEGSLDALMENRPSRVVVMEHVSNADNVGGIFRCAAAFGAAVIAGEGCCDPLYRKAIRTSMGAALRTPFAPADEWPEALERLRDAGYLVVALTPSGAEDLNEAAGEIRASRRMALLAGGEGTGLTSEALGAADRRVRIGIRPEVDSLNVAVAVGIALHALTPRSSSFVVRSS
jgi:tRNA G18 (ribose-2'-O)-methylase SpoU